MGPIKDMILLPTMLLRGMDMIGMPKMMDLSGISSEKARKDTPALLIGRLFYETTKSHELMIESMIHLRADPERMEGVIGTLLSLLYSSITGNGSQPHRWKELTDYLCETLNIDHPGDL